MASRFGFFRGTFIVISGYIATSSWAQAQASTLFDLPAQTLDASLRSIGKTTATNILIDRNLVSGLQAPALKAQLTVDQAIARLLQGTGLTYKFVNEHTVVLSVAADESTGGPKRSVEPPAAKPIAGRPADDSSPRRLAQLNLSGRENVPDSETKSVDGRAAGEKAADVEQVVVTGSHIRGVNPTSPLHTVTRLDIEQSGYSQIGDVMRSLPENFAGGQNPAVQSAASITNAANNNVTNASTINLRGLGSDATLVLLNGHRLSADSFFQASDISGIPLSAVERIEVVPDGASALYGSDAVAGVVNIILRRNYDGVDASARVGGASRGGGLEQTYSVLGGMSADNAYVLANLEYSNQEKITWKDRDLTAIGGSDNTLLQPQRRTSFFVSAGMDLSERAKLSFDGLVSDRKTNDSTRATSTDTQYLSDTKTPAYSAAAMLDVDLVSDWRLHVTAVGSGSRNESRTWAPAISYDYSGLTKNAVRYGEASADGTLFSLSTGDIKGAIGGGQRTQTYFSRGSDLDLSRRVRYLFGELSAPLVSRSAARVGLHELEVNLSGRMEDYSDFGKSSKPKLGLRYVPFEDLSLRGTWGKSFKAPSFDQMYDEYLLYLHKAATLGYPGPGTTLYSWGANPQLGPEEAKSWTVGGDYRLQAVPSLTLSATYFNIRFTDRIVNPVSPPTQGLSNPNFAPFVQYAPSIAEQASLVAAADEFINFSGGDYDPATVVAFVNNQYTNATAQTARGTDLSYRQKFNLAGGSIDAFANATWMRLAQQTIETLPSVVLSGTIFNPPKFKARAGLSWQRAGFSATGVANYLSAETDGSVTPNAHVASWTTLDANVAYRVAEGAGGLEGLRLELAASNLLDKDPPYTVTPVANTGPHFDSTNSSLLGRFVSLTLSKTW